MIGPNRRPNCWFRRWSNDRRRVWNGIFASEAIYYQVGLVMCPPFPSRTQPKCPYKQKLLNSYVWVRPLQCFEQFRYPSSLFVSAFPEIVYYFHSSKPRPCFLLQYLDKSTPSRIYAPPHSQAPASFQWRVICLNYSSSMIMFFAFQKIFLLLDFVRLAGLLLDLEKLE